ncbi:hypothetical protein AVEN_93061-1 [Araneus ventricosus]|uniref:CCHC-type domain-containing protein n=1 Tax=Araneus ventricosus TaxID=182803 RepID=A0A4Y2Q2N9_ARAVE|nr:hypothetical protein AVEN_93061-1 [Araneus ventricosus]
MYGVWLGSSCCLEATGYHPPLRFKDLLWGIPYFSSGEPVRYLSPTTALFEEIKNFHLVFLQSKVCAKASHKSINVTNNIPVAVSAHATLNSSKGVVSCGELLNVPIEEILKGFQPQGVTQVQRIKIRKNGQLIGTKHLILTFHSPRIPESVRAGYIKLTVRPYIPNPLRCFKCQRFGHSKDSCRGTLTCARCAEAGQDSSNCTESEKCVNCKGSQTSFSRLCSAWKFEKEIKKPSEASNSLIKESNITGAKNGTKSAHVCFVGPVPDSMAAFPPEKTKLLQSLESDADAEMSSSSASEGDTLEYDMSEDLEDTPQNICPTTLPPPSTARKR